MKIKVRVFVGEKEVSPEELHKLVIKSKYIDRVVNAIYEQNTNHSADTTEPSLTL